MTRSPIVHPTAIVSADACLAKDVNVGAYSIVGAGVSLGQGTTVTEYCQIGCGPFEGTQPTVIAPCAKIRSHTVIYAGSSFGKALETGHHVVIREGTRAGENLRVGNFSDVEGDCTIGDFCRFHGYSHVGKGSTVGDFVWLFSLTTLTNDPLPPSNLKSPVTIEDGVVVCVGVTIMPGTHLGKGSFISAGSKVHGMIPAGAVVSGSEGRIINHIATLLHLESGTRHPWMRHYSKQYPDRVLPRLQKLQDDILENRFTLTID